MRPLTQGDILAAARRIRPMPPELRRGAVMAMLERAHAADRFRKRLGRAHPQWGNGSLMAAALGAGAPAGEPPRTDAGQLEAVAVVIEAILAWRRRAG